MRGVYKHVSDLWRYFLKWSNIGNFPVRRPWLSVTICGACPRRLILYVVLLLKMSKDRMHLICVMQHELHRCKKCTYYLLVKIYVQSKEEKNFYNRKAAIPKEISVLSHWRQTVFQQNNAHLYIVHISVSTQQSEKNLYGVGLFTLHIQ